MSLNAAFWKWFGNSVVRNEDGTPRVVYRGDGPDKAQFTGREDKSCYIQGNIFFTDSLSIAKFYTKYRTNYRIRPSQLGESDGLYRVYLSLQHPMLVDAKGEDWSEINFEGCDLQIDDIAMAARKRGYDGLIVFNVWDQAGFSTQYIAFNPEQIKSIDNDGTWDADDPNIGSNPPVRRLLRSKNIGTRSDDREGIMLNRPEGIPDVLWDAVTDQLLEYHPSSKGPLADKYGQLQFALDSTTGLKEGSPGEWKGVFEDLARRWEVQWSPEIIQSLLSDANKFYADCVEKKWGFPRPAKPIWEMSREEYERPVWKRRRPVVLTGIGVHSLPEDRDIREFLDKWEGSTVLSDSEISDIGTFGSPMRVIEYVTPSGIRRWAYVLIFSGVDSFAEEYVVSDRPIDVHAAGSLMKEFNAATRHAYPACKLPIHHDSIRLCLQLIGLLDADDPNIRSNPESALPPGGEFSLEHVIGHLQATDGTGDPDWVEHMIQMVSPYDRWEIQYLDPSETDDRCSDQETAEEYAQIIEQLPPAVAIPMEDGRFEIVDGGHRMCAAGIAEVTFPTYVPVGTRRHAQ